MITPENIGDFASRHHTDNVIARWWNVDMPLPDLYDRRLGLILSEVGEALDHLRHPCRPYLFTTDTGKPDGYLIEVADTALRALDLLGHLAPSRPVSTCMAWPETPKRQGRWEFRVSALVALRAADNRPYTLGRICAQIVMECQEEANRHGADLVDLMNAKKAYNATRPPRHGGLSY